MSSITITSTLYSDIRLPNRLAIFDTLMGFMKSENRLSSDEGFIIKWSDFSEDRALVLSFPLPPLLLHFFLTFPPSFKNISISVIILS